MGYIGMQELVIILAVCLLIFGPSQLPKLGRSLGQTLDEFRKVGQSLHGEDEP